MRTNENKIKSGGEEHLAPYYPLYDCDQKQKSNYNVFHTKLILSERPTIQTLALLTDHHLSLQLVLMADCSSTMITTLCMDTQ